MAITLKYALKVIIYQVYYYILGTVAIIEDFIYRRSNRTELIERAGEVAVITGGARGIGVEVVKCLLKCDMEVIVGCRTSGAGQSLHHLILSEGIKTGNLSFFTLDMASMKSVREFAAKVKQKCPAIHLLINNAGIMFVPFSLTEDGFESHLGVNYLGHCLLTHLLLPQLKQAGCDTNRNARIVNVSSSAHLAGNINFKDMNMKDEYLGSEAYAQSKLAQVLFTKKLESLLREAEVPVQVHAVHPGVVNTQLFDGTFIKILMPWAPQLLFKTPRRGATTIVHACLAPSLEGQGGTYLSNCRVTDTCARANCKNLQDKLWDAMRKLIEVHRFGDL